MTSLPPLFPDVTLIPYKGKYQIQLEVFNDATITTSDIDKILTLASWEQHPQTIAEGYEGGRSILINREKPFNRGKIAFNALQLSGIGYQKFKQTDQEGTVHVVDKTFYPPTSHNFLEGLSQRAGGYSYAKGNQIIDKRSSYLPYGTYLQRELETKIKNTCHIATYSPKHFVVPTIEAYGRYLDPNLSKDGAPFGFILLNAPSTSAKRFYDGLFKKMLYDNPKKPAELFRTEMKKCFTLLPTALRELHDLGYAHLQPHFSNFYILNDTLLLVDWETLITLDTRKEDTELDFASNRALDFKIPLQQYYNALDNFFPSLWTEIKDICYKEIVAQATSCYLTHKQEHPFNLQREKTRYDLDDFMNWMLQFDPRISEELYKRYMNAIETKKTLHIATIPQ